MRLSNNLFLKNKISAILNLLAMLATVAGRLMASAGDRMAEGGAAPHFKANALHSPGRASSARLLPFREKRAARRAMKHGAGRNMWVKALIRRVSGMFLDATGRVNIKN